MKVLEGRAAACDSVRGAGELLCGSVCVSVACVCLTHRALSALGRGCVPTWQALQQAGALKDQSEPAVLGRISEECRR